LSSFTRASSRDLFLEFLDANDIPFTGAAAEAGFFREGEGSAKVVDGESKERMRRGDGGVTHHSCSAVMWATQDHSSLCCCREG
jgi:hypothetical protein